MSNLSPLFSLSFEVIPPPTFPHPDLYLLRIFHVSFFTWAVESLQSVKTVLCYIVTRMVAIDTFIFRRTAYIGPHRLNYWPVVLVHWWIYVNKQKTYWYIYNSFEKLNKFRHWRLIIKTNFAPNLQLSVCFVFCCTE